MTLSKSTRAELRRRCPTPGETDALLDMADERDRYRALLIVAASVLSEDGDMTEADAHALYRRIDKALEGKA